MQAFWSLQIPIIPWIFAAKYSNLYIILYVLVSQLLTRLCQASQLGVAKNMLQLLCSDVTVMTANGKQTMQTRQCSRHYSVVLQERIYIENIQRIYRNIQRLYREYIWNMQRIYLEYIGNTLGIRGVFIVYRDVGQ